LFDSRIAGGLKCPNDRQTFDAAIVLYRRVDAINGRLYGISYSKGVEPGDGRLT